MKMLKKLLIFPRINVKIINGDLLKRLKRTHSKCVRRRQACRGSNPLISVYFNKQVLRCYSFNALRLIFLLRMGGSASLVEGSCGIISKNKKIGEGI